jgi:hypothetical protein
MDGGFISGNTANKGGGVAVQNVGNFSKAAGPSVRIYGNNAAPLFKNTALAGGGEGHAVWVSENDAHTTSAFRDVTVDEGDSLSQPYSAW